jgi:hypothetical protein
VNTVQDRQESSRSNSTSPAILASPLLSSH